MEFSRGIIGKDTDEDLLRNWVYLEVHAMLNSKADILGR